VKTILTLAVVYACGAAMWLGAQVTPWWLWSAALVAASVAGPMAADEFRGWLHERARRRVP
jgi:uncharacterized membrane protein